jgi:hypothetical protein
VEGGGGVVGGTQVRRHAAHADVTVRRPLDPAWGEHAIGGAGDQQRQQQPWMLLRLATRDRSHRKGAKRHPLDRRHHDMRHVVLRQPVLGVRRQQERSVRA